MVHENSIRLHTHPTGRMVTPKATLHGTLSGPGPNDPLILFCDRRQALVNKLLDALPVIGLGGEYVALRIRGDAVYGVEFTRLPPAVAEAGHHFQRFAIDDPDLLVGAVRQEDIFLLRIFRKRDIPDRAVPQRV